VVVAVHLLLVLMEFRKLAVLAVVVMLQALLAHQ